MEAAGSCLSPSTDLPADLHHSRCNTRTCTSQRQARAASRDSRGKRHLPSCHAEVTHTTLCTASPAQQQWHYEVHGYRAEGGETETISSHPQAKRRSEPRWLVCLYLFISASLCLLAGSKITCGIAVLSRDYSVWGTGHYCL